MKKLKLFLLATGMASGIFAQNFNVQSAANKFKDNQIEEAKKFIDEAAENTQTNNDFKMWYFRGKIYWAIAQNPKYQSLDAEATEKATTSFINCLNTDKKGWYKNEVSEVLIDCAIELYNKASEALNNNQSNKAIQLYTMIFDIMPFDKNKALVRHNMSSEILYRNCYKAAFRTNDFTTAITYMQKLIDMNYNDPAIYIDMTQTYLIAKDTVKALNVLGQGRKIFDDNAEMMALEIGIYETQGNIQKVIDKYTEAISITPANELLYLTRGTIYEKINDLPKAETDYKKAIELKPDYFDAIYLLGKLFFNAGAEIIEKANDIMDNTKYQAEKNKADEQFKKALPYLEKAFELNPEDKPTMESLKQLYARMSMKEKFEEINKK